MFLRWYHRHLTRIKQNLNITKMQLLEPHCIQIVATQWLQGHFSVSMMISVGVTKSDVKLHNSVLSWEKWFCDAKKVSLVFDFIYFWKPTTVDFVRSVSVWLGFHQANSVVPPSTPYHKFCAWVHSCCPIFVSNGHAWWSGLKKGKAW